MQALKTSSIALGEGLSHADLLIILQIANITLANVRTLVEPVEQSEPNQLNSGSVSPPFSRLGDSKNEAQLKEHGVSLQDPEHYGTFESVEGFEDKG